MLKYLNDFIFIDQHLAPMLNMAKNGVSRAIVKLAIIVNIVIHVPNNNFIRKSTSLPNAMMFNKPVIVLAVYFVHLLTLNVSFFSIFLFPVPSYYDYFFIILIKYKTIHIRFISLLHTYTLIMYTYIPFRIGVLFSTTILLLLFLKFYFNDISFSN